jgi:hypothetical protein
LEKTPAIIPDHWWDAIREFWMWSDSELTGTIQEIGVPIIAINAEEPPTNVEAFRQYSPSFELMTIPDVAHLGVLWTKPEVFVERLEEAAGRMVEGG